MSMNNEGAINLPIKPAEARKSLASPSLEKKLIKLQQVQDVLGHKENGDSPFPLRGELDEKEKIIETLTQDLQEATRRIGELENELDEMEEELEEIKQEKQVLLNELLTSGVSK